jgi:hypothetical protein
MTVCVRLEEVGGGRGELPAKGFGGMGGESSRLGKSAAASFDYSNMALAASFVSKPPRSSILATETEAVSQPPNENVRTSIIGLP